MTIVVDLQIVSASTGLPDITMITRWLSAIDSMPEDAEVTVRIVDEEESASLNETYRKRSGSTNVLSFEYEPPAQIQSVLLGDLVICAPVVEREAREQGKKMVEHWAHMVIHGALHLLGYDHQTDPQAARMETLEADILDGLGYTNPYLVV